MVLLNGPSEYRLILIKAYGFKWTSLKKKGNKWSKIHACEILTERFE